MITGKIEGKIQREDTGIRTAGDPNIAIHQAADRSQRQKEPSESLHGVTIPNYGERFWRDM